MSLKENRPIAWVVLGACVLGSVFGLGGASLAREQDALEELFFQGEPQVSALNCMDAYLDRAAECAQVMASEAQLRLGADQPVAAKMMDALASFGDEAGMDARYEAYLQLQQLSDQLYNAFYASDLPDAQRVNFKRAYDDFWGWEKYIRLDPYRKAAAKYNRSLDGFLPSIAAGIWGAEEMNSFGA